MSELKSIQCLRGFAAILVVYTHLTGIQDNYPNRPFVLPYGSVGAIGVDIFFVISGFIIAFILARGAMAPADFAARRFFRIVPIYWLFTLLALAAVLVNPAWTQGGAVPTPADTMKSLFMLPQERLPVLFVGWSIEHEMLFYVVMGLLLAFGKVRFAPQILIGLGLAGLFPGLIQNAWSAHLFSKYNFLFAAGILIFQERDRLRVLGTGGAVAISVLIVVALVASGLPLGGPRDPSLVRIVALGAASTFLFAGLLNLERKGAFATRRIAGVIALAALIGDASYILYLSHPFTLSLVGDKLGVRLGVSGMLVPFWLTLSFAATVAVAIVIHRMFEAPFLKYTHRMVARLKTA